MTLEEKLMEVGTAYVAIENVCPVNAGEDRLNNLIRSHNIVIKKLEKQKEILEIVNKKMGIGGYSVKWSWGLIESLLKCYNREGKVGVDITIQQDYDDKIKKADSNIEAIDVVIEAVRDRIELFKKIKKLLEVEL